MTVREPEMHSNGRVRADRSSASEAVYTAIREAAKEWGITRITFLDGRTSSFCQVKNAGWSGPDLTDFEAAVLIASGVPWSVYQRRMP